MPNPVSVLPDVVLAVLQYLRSVADVTALVPAGRITTRLPADPTYPVVLAHRGGGIPDVPQWIDVAAVQVDVVGGDQETCSLLTRTVAAAIVAIANDPAGGTVLVSAAVEVGPQWLPDTTVVPPLSRYVARYQIHAHNN